MTWRDFECQQERWHCCILVAFVGSVAMPQSRLIACGLVADILNWGLG